MTARQMRQQAHGILRGTRGIHDFCPGIRAGNGASPASAGNRETLAGRNLSSDQTTRDQGELIPGTTEMKWKPILLIVICGLSAIASGEPRAFTPGSRVLMDAHNCYPYGGKWETGWNALFKTGTPLAIEQDLFWYTNPRTHQSQSLVTHGKPIQGRRADHARLLLRAHPSADGGSLKEGDHGDWPLITLNLDFKSDESAHHAEVWKLLQQYEPVDLQRRADQRQANGDAAYGSGPCWFLPARPTARSGTFTISSPGRAAAGVWSSPPAGKRPDVIGRGSGQAARE